MEIVNFDIPTIDLNDRDDMQVIVDIEEDQYLGHVTTVLLDDKKTIIAVYPKGHGKGAVVMKKSYDKGMTWSERLDVPESWETSQEVPTIYKVPGKDGNGMLIMFSGLYPIRMAKSFDMGETWTELEAIGDYGGIVTMASLVVLDDGRVRAYFHDDGRFIKNSGVADDKFKVYQVTSYDGGMTWGEPEVIALHSDAHLCEPGMVVSPDGKKLCLLLRENSRQYNSFAIFSDDGGDNWSLPIEMPRELTGDRHTAKYAKDGRLVVTFRDMAKDSPTLGDWVCWVGKWDDIINCKSGQMRIRLKDNQSVNWVGDCAYPGLELLPSGEFTAVTYGHWQRDIPPYILAVRFTLDEMDEILSR